MDIVRESTHTWDCKIYFEDCLRIDNNFYYLIVGRHANGGFIALPEWGVSCQASLHITGYDYNRDNLIAHGLDPDIAEAIARYVHEWLDEHLLYLHDTDSYSFTGKTLKERFDAREI